MTAEKRIDTLFSDEQLAFVFGTEGAGELRNKVMAEGACPVELDEAGWGLLRQTLGADYGITEAAQGSWFVEFAYTVNGLKLTRLFQP
jgi:hypothetical protein